MTTDLTPPRYTVTAHDAPGASTAPGHEGADAQVYAVVDNTRGKFSPAILTATVTPWRIEYTYPQGQAFITTSLITELPPELLAAQAMIEAAVTRP